jgi:hypothetical protein
MQNRGHGLLDGRIGGIVELQKPGQARLEIRLRTIESGQRNHRIPFPKMRIRLYRFLAYCRLRLGSSR